MASEGPERRDSEELPRLDQVYVSNHHPEPQTVHVLVERGDEIAYWNTFDIKGLDEEENVAYGETIEPPSFPRERADWRISARLDGRTTGVRQRLQKVAPPGCYRFTIRVTAEEEFMFLHDSPSCPTTTIE